MAYSDIGLIFNLSDIDIQNFDFKKWFHESNSTEDTYLKKQSESEVILKITLYVVAILVSLIGNLAVIIVIISTKSLRTKFNFYILNLAVVDLLVPLTCMWLHLIYDLYPASWPLGQFFCRINIFMQVTVVCVGIFTLTVTVVDRFFASIYPSVLNLTQKRQIPIIVCIWLAGILTALPWILYTKMKTYDWFGGPQTICQPHFPSAESRRIYTTIFVVVGYFIPLIIMFILVILTYKKAQPLREPVTVALEIYENSRRKAVHMVFTVLIVFFICWTPQQFLRLWDEYRSRDINAKIPNGIETFTYISFYIAYLNSCINPFICLAYNKCLRQSAWEMITCTRPRVSSHSVAPAITIEFTVPAGEQEQGLSTSDVRVQGSSTSDVQEISGDLDLTMVSTSS